MTKNRIRKVEKMKKINSRRKRSYEIAPRDPQYVGKVIISQIKGLDFWALARWGARDYVTSKNGIDFKASGPSAKRSCKILIRLTPMDVYDVTLYNYTRAMKGKEGVIDKVKGVYDDQLVDTIDRILGYETTY